ncbi:MAG: CDP-alcohol phosphatidyltransferase family protein [Syntrophobacteraceae bacterium]
MSFKLKDVCTVINILMALYAVIVSCAGRLELASWIIFAAWFMDGLDGWIARLTNSSNEFGVHFDNQADLFIYTVAPAFYVYGVFLDYSPVLGTVICFTVITIGCIRLSRFNVKPLIYPGFWIGYPRSALGLYIIFLFNSKFFGHYKPYAAAAVLTLILTAMNLAYIPYRNHKTKFTRFELFVVFSVLVTAPAVFPFGYFWDVALIWSSIYVLLPFTPLHAKYSASIKNYVLEWKSNAC